MAADIKQHRLPLYLFKERPSTTTLHYTMGSFPGQEVSTMKSEEENVTELSVDLTIRAKPRWSGTFHRSLSSSQEKKLPLWFI